MLYYIYIRSELPVQLISTQNIQFTNKQNHEPHEFLKQNVSAMFDDDKKSCYFDH